MLTLIKYTWKKLNKNFIHINQKFNNLIKKSNIIKIKDKCPICYKKLINYNNNAKIYMLLSIKKINNLKIMNWQLKYKSHN